MKFKEKLWEFIFLLAAGFSILAVFLICLFLFVNGIPAMHKIGFFGLMVLVPFVRNVFGGNGSSILTASILLGMMILPTIISVSETALNAVPQSYYEGSRALGANELCICKKAGVAGGV